MYFLEDEMLAKSLQMQYGTPKDPYKESPNKENRNIIDSQLEYVDPTPNIHMLFVQFDKKFFWGSLQSVEVKWSQRMTTCAGICSYRGKRGGCVISLSAPLLSLRPRKDLVETLLHEMIHAYLFVTENDDDRDGHGPQFHKHMNRINKEAGTNISVYHSFHDEVEYHQRHIWRCNGLCQNKKPFFGFVRRASNRAPGPNDFWWSKHTQECGGTFIKISEPEKALKKRSTSKGKVSPSQGTKDIRSFFNPTNPASSSGLPSNVVGFVDLTTGVRSKHSSSSGDVGLSKKPKVSPGSSKIFGFNDLPSENKKPRPGTSGMLANRGGGTFVITNPKTKKGVKAEKSPTNKETGTEKKLTGGKKNVKSDNKPVKNKKDGKYGDIKANGLGNNNKNNDCEVRETVRSIWANKVLQAANNHESCSATEKVIDKRKNVVQCPVCEKLIIEADLELHVDGCLLKNEHKEHSTFKLTKTSQSESEDIMKASTNRNQSPNIFLDAETAVCSICNEQFLQSHLKEHMKNCVDCIFINDNVDGPSDNSEKEKQCHCPVCNTEISQSRLNEHLEECLNCSFENEQNDFDADEEEKKDVNCESVVCPCCFKWFSEGEMNSHIDDCLTMMALKNGLLDP